MPKTWEEMDDGEKIEDLRRDVIRIFDVLNALVADVRNSHDRTNTLETKMNEVSREISRLSGLLPKE